MSNSKLFVGVIWYNLIISIIAIILYLPNFVSSVLSAPFSIFLVSITLLVVDGVRLVFSISLVKNRKSISSSIVLLVYLFFQAFYCNIHGKVYLFNVGPKITIIYNNAVKSIVDFSFSFWSQDFNFSIDRTDVFYFGFNLIPLFVGVVMLFEIRKNIKRLS